jgi:hypothetical protein
MTALLKSSMNGSSVSSSEAVTQGARRATEGRASGATGADPEVVETARRRQFSVSEKRSLVGEADACKERGELGAFLRRKRIYSSMLSSWRKQIAAADRVALAPKKRGPKPDPAARQFQHLNRDIARLHRRLERAELIIEAQKETMRGTGAADLGRSNRGGVMLAVAQLAPHIGLKAACRGFVYRARPSHQSATRCVPHARPRPPLALCSAEQDLLLGLLNSERFADVAPATVFATLLDEGCYHGSIRTMYRLLAAQSQ